MVWVKEFLPLEARGWGGGIKSGGKKVEGAAIGVSLQNRLWPPLLFPPSKGMNSGVGVGFIYRFSPSLFLRSGTAKYYSVLGLFAMAG